jgi:hypothetical protein
MGIKKWEDDERSEEKLKKLYAAAERKVKEEQETKDREQRRKVQFEDVRYVFSSPTRQQCAG